MNYNKLIINTILMLMSLGGSLAFAAEDYNQGFIAAERGQYKNAVDLLTPLAEQGYAPAQFNLALMYHGGLGVPQNEALAVKLYQSAAENGYASAQQYMAVGYQEGWFGLPRDKAQAKYWYDKLNQE